MEKNEYPELALAQDFADQYSTCTKVKVGSYIKTVSGRTIFGCNVGIGYDCRKEGCRRIKLYGEASKYHRLPSDCASLHSEINAIATAAAEGVSLKGATIFVTRYPCEACARAIASSGIVKVVYGRKEAISKQTELILDSAGVIVEQVDFDWEDNNT